MSEVAEARAILKELIPDQEITGTLLKSAETALSSFKSFDTDGNGTLCLEEFKKIPATANEAEFVFKLMDLDQSKYITKKEYIQFIAADALGKTYRPYFDSLDKDRSGFIEVSEFKQFLKGRGYEQAKVDELVKKMDKDGNGKVDYPEFRNFFARV